MTDQLFVLKDVKQLVELLKSSDVNEIEVSHGERTIRVRRDATVQTVAPAVGTHTSSHTAGLDQVAMPAMPNAATAPAQTPDIQGKVIESPMVGTFYRSATPEASPFVKSGDPVKKGQILCIIEAMKTMNQIEAEHDGIIKQILVENAQPVEFGEPLFVVE